MSGDVRQALTEALAEHRMCAGSRKGVVCSCGWEGQGSQYEGHVAESLSGTADRIARERAAAELRKAAEEYEAKGHVKFAAALRFAANYLDIVLADELEAQP